MNHKLESPQDIFPSAIGPYQVLKKIGQGGMGEVYLVYDAENAREIALKKMLQNEKSESRKKQFSNESHLSQLLEHPSIVPIYSIVEEGDLVYYTMPFIEGKTLKQTLSEALAKEREEGFLHTNLPLAEILKIFSQICEVVAYAHSKGVLHRDLKPSNILLGSNGEVYLLDWGLGKKVLTHDIGEERVTVSGTIAYLAPEIMLGKPYSMQAEIYSLGLILYQMLTLKLPFHRFGQEEYFQNMQKEVLFHPAKAAPLREVPQDLAEIALKCLEELPEKRYSNIEAILLDLYAQKNAAKDLLKTAYDYYAQGDVKQALKTCKNVQRSYPIYAEGYEAIYLAGLCFIPKDNITPTTVKKALKEFDKLQGTPKAPLKYFGYIEIYQLLNNKQAEINTFEQVFERFTRHPLMPRLQKLLFERMEALANSSRKDLYPYVLLLLRFIKSELWPSTMKVILEQVKSQLVPFDFLDRDNYDAWNETFQNHALWVHLAYLLEKPLVLASFIDQGLTGPFPIVSQALLALIKLRKYALAQEKLDILSQEVLDIQAVAYLDSLQNALKICQSKAMVKPFPLELPKKLSDQHLQPLWLIFEELLHQHQASLVSTIANDLIMNYELEAKQILDIDCYLAWALLLENKADEAKVIIHWHLERKENSDVLDFLSSYLFNDNFVFFYSDENLFQPEKSKNEDKKALLKQLK